MSLDVLVDYEMHSRSYDFLYLFIGTICIDCVSSALKVVGHRSVYALAIVY